MRGVYPFHYDESGLLFRRAAGHSPLVVLLELLRKVLILSFHSKIAA